MFTVGYERFLCCDIEYNHFVLWHLMTIWWAVSLPKNTSSYKFGFVAGNGRKKRGIRSSMSKINTPLHGQNLQPLCAFDKQVILHQKKLNGIISSELIVSQRRNRRPGNEAQSAQIVFWINVLSLRLPTGLPESPSNSRLTGRVCVGLQDKLYYSANCARLIAVRSSFPWIKVFRQRYVMFQAVPGSASIVMQYLIYLSREVCHSLTDMQFAGRSCKYTWLAPEMPRTVKSVIKTGTPIVPCSGSI